MGFFLMPPKIIPINIRDVITVPNIHYMRYGDSEIWAIIGDGRTNSSGHSHNLPGLQDDLTKTITSPKHGIIYGIGPLGIEKMTDPGKGRFRIATTRDPKSIPWHRVVWYHGDLWKDAYLDGTFKHFLTWLSTIGKVGIIGPPWIERLREKYDINLAHFQTQKNCYTQKEDAFRFIEEHADQVDTFLFCASMLTNVAIYHFHEKLRKHRLIDCGAAFDPFCGVPSRAFHEGFK